MDSTVNTDSDNTIECVISDDKRSAQFDCTKPFKLFDDRETLSLMRMGQCDEDTLAKMLPGTMLLVWQHFECMLSPEKGGMILVWVSAF